MFNERLFMATLVIQDKKLKDVADALGIDRATLYRKIRDDGKFTRAEITRIVDYLCMDAETMSRIFFAEQLA